MKTIRTDIEEAALRYAESLRESGMYEKETPATKEDMAYAFKAGADYIMSLPLCDRLTSEEKAKMKAKYQEELEFAQFYQIKANSCRNITCKVNYETSRDIAKSRAAMLKKIFGTAMFEEKGEEDV